MASPPGGECLNENTGFGGETHCFLLADNTEALNLGSRVTILIFAGWGVMRMVIWAYDIKFRTFVLLDINHPSNNRRKSGRIMEGHQGEDRTEGIPLNSYQ